MEVLLALCAPLTHVPARRGRVGCQDGEGTCVVPAEAHGEERDVAAVGLIPAWSSPRRGQHKPNLVTDRGGVRHQYTSGFSMSLFAFPPAFISVAKLLQLTMGWRQNNPSNTQTTALSTITSSHGQGPRGELQEESDALQASLRALRAAQHPHRKLTT